MPTTRSVPRSHRTPTAMAERDARVVDMERRLRPVRTATLLVLGVALLLSGPWAGFWTLVPLAVAAVGFAVVGRGLDRSRRPGRRVAVAWVLSVVAIAVAVAAAGGPDSPMVAWLAIPVVTLPARFDTRGVALGCVFVAVCIVAVTVGVDPQHVAEAPPELFGPLALLIAVGTLSLALMQSDLEHRSAAVVDAMTGMLNRGALLARTAELAQQAAYNDHPIAVIAGDLDRFKAINDGHGHQAGDAVLREVAERLRGRLRAFDLAYRVGGEEFVVLMPGADVPEAARLAEDLRRAIRDAPVAGLHVTMSFGVAASPPGQFDYEQVFAAADRALYDAKAAGRDRVVVADDHRPASVAG